MSTIHHRSITPIIISFLAVSCGGGGGGTPEPIFTAQPAIAITAEKSPEIVSEAVSGVTGSGVDIGFRSDSNSVAPGFDLPNFLDRFKSLTGQRTASKTANRTEPFPCVEGTGTVTISDDLLTLSATFSNCLYEGDTWNGSLSLVENESTGSTLISFTNFSLVGFEFSVSLNGSMIETWTEFSDHDHYVSNGANMVMTLSFQGRSITMGNFYEVSDDYFAGYEIFNTRYVANSSSFGGSYSLETSQDIYINYIDDYPYRGQVIVTGSSGSKVRATSLGSGSPSGLVLIETDADGDGAYEDSITMSWAQLEDSLVP